MAYNAFISYSHVDSTIATALQSALHRFATPWYKLRGLHVFRDQTNLAVNPALWSSIREALDQSLFFILLASPESAASPWVAKEAEYWINKNGTSHVLIVLTGGTLQWDKAAACFAPERTTALPPNLLRSFPEEPLFLDLVWARDKAARMRLREPRFHEAVLQLSSTLLNRPKDELDGADIRVRRQTSLVAICGLVVLLLTAFFAWRQTRIGQEESRENLAAGLAAQAAKVLADNPDRAPEAALLAIESNRLNPSFEGNQALRAAVALLPGGAQLYRPDNSFPTQRVRDLAFSADGASLAVVRDDGSTQLFDLLHHKPAGFLSPDEQPAANIKFPGESPSDQEAAVSVAFDSTGTILATGSRDGVAHVYAVQGARELLRITHGSAVSQIAFRPGYKQLATATDDGHVRVFDVTHGTTLADFQGEGKMVATCFSPGGDVLAALSSEGVVSVYDPVQLKPLRTMNGGEAAFNLAFSKDGKRLATASGDFAFVWDVTSGQQLLKATHAASSETLNPQQWIVDAAISSDGKLLAYAARGDRTAHLWNVDTGRQILELKHDSSVAAVAFNADGSRLGTGSYDGTARVWELPAGIELERASLGGGAEVVAFSPDGQRFAAGGMEGSISVSETRRADRPASFNVPAAVRSVAFSPDGKRLAIGTTSKAWPLVRIADIEGNVLSDIQFHGAPVIDRLFFQDSNHVVANWSNRRFLVAVDKGLATPLPDFRAESGVEPTGQLRTVEVHKSPNDFVLEIWSVANQSRVSRVQLPAELNHRAFNPAKTILFTTEGERLQGWDLPSGKQRFALTASGDIDVIIPDPTSASVATLTHGHLTVWDAASGARLSQLPDIGYIRAAAFSPDGRYLLTGSDQRSASLWLWRSSDLETQACGRLTRNLSREEWGRSFGKQAYRRTCPNLPPGN